MNTPAEFEWDDAKAKANIRNHGVRFEVAATVFQDPHHVVISTVRVEDGEDRMKAIGLIADRLFAVVFVMRGDVCRVISARRTNPKEDRVYG